MASFQTSHLVHVVALFFYLSAGLLILLTGDELEFALSVHNVAPCMQFRNGENGWRRLICVFGECKSNSDCNFVANTIGGKGFTPTSNTF